MHYLNSNFANQNLARTEATCFGKCSAADLVFVNRRSVVLQAEQRHRKNLTCEDQDLGGWSKARAADKNTLRV